MEKTDDEASESSSSESKRQKLDNVSKVEDKSEGCSHAPRTYVGRIAPTPSGHLHVGHAQTFLIAKRRADFANGKLVLRIEDLDAARCKSHYYDDMVEDLKWMGIDWVVGPNYPSSDLELGPMTPFLTSPDLLSLNLTEFRQSARMPIYFAAFRYLLSRGCIYPSPHSRKDVERAISAPHEGEVEPLFPPSLRPDYITSKTAFPEDVLRISTPNELGQQNWRFCDGEVIEFTDGRFGDQRYECGVDIGDFVVWRGSDNIPSYEFAVVVDDLCMGVTEVVRGFDLLQSTARQLLLYRAFGIIGEPNYNSTTPQFYHCPLIRDANGIRLAKRSFSQSIRTLRESGFSVERIIREFFDPAMVDEFGLLVSSEESKLDNNGSKCDDV